MERSDPVQGYFSRYALSVGVCVGGAIVLAWLCLAYLCTPEEAMMVGPMDHDVWSAPYLLTSFSMWLVMMVAMMLPAAAMMILFYARYAIGSGMAGGGIATAWFTMTYVAIWAGFSLVATLLQAMLTDLGIVSMMTESIVDRRVAGAVLLVAGLYQLSPLKQACLKACRSPLEFVVRLWRPGVGGAIRLGAAHGLYCLGCCWALMLILFVAGVMNLVWIAALSMVVLVEKVAPAGLRLSLVLGGILTAAGLALIALPA